MMVDVQVLGPSRATSLNARSASVPNFSRVIRGRDNALSGDSINRKLPLGQNNTMNVRKVTGVKRWDPRSRSSSPWDELRRVSHRVFSAKLTLTRCRMKNSGLKMEIVMCTSMAKESPKEGHLSKLAQRISKPPVALG